MSKKSKIAIALLGALFSNNSASAMNTNKNINKNLSVQTSDFSISKNTKLDSKSAQPVGTVGGGRLLIKVLRKSKKAFRYWKKF